MSKREKVKLPKAAIFDMDGLLFDTERLFKRKKAVVMKKYGYEQREGDYEKTLGACGEKLNEILFSLYGPEYPAAAISEETRQLVVKEAEESGIPVKDGIPQLLQWLQEMGIPCGVASSTYTPYIRQSLSRAGIEAYFTCVIGGEQVPESKPDPMIFLTACERMHVSPEDALVLEDSPNGVLAAIRAGIPVICIPDLVRPEESILSGTLAVVDTAAEVPAIFQASPAGE